MSDNRLEALAAFLAANPDLPGGTDTPDTTPAPRRPVLTLILIHISESTRLLSISYVVFCLQKIQSEISDPGSCF